MLYGTCIRAEISYTSLYDLCELFPEQWGSSCSQGGGVVKDFKEVLYESLLFSFGKILANYNAFAQDTVLSEAGKEILDYLGRNGYDFKEEGTLDDVPRLIEFFSGNGFAEVEVSSSERCSDFKWGNLYGIQAYAELQAVTENPFLSCPLNACVHHIAGKYGKALHLHSKSFDLEAGVAYSREELVDSESVNEEGFDSLIIENRRLLQISENHEAALREALEEVNRLASTDHLTGLKNRRQFLHLAEQEFKGTLRFNRPMSAIMLDVDHFKPINDTFGHAEGDAVLQKIARCCTDTMRRVDIIGRYGGDEFAIILPESGLSSAIFAAERLRKVITEECAEVIERGTGGVTVSLGVASLEDDHVSISDLLVAADNALYAAKRKGGNQVCCHNNPEYPQEKQ